MTLDHSVAGQMVRHNVIKRSQMKGAQQALVNVIGMDPENFTAEPSSVQVRKHDILLFCTDGLTNELSDAEIASTIVEHAGNGMAAVADALIKGALFAGGRDNVSVVLAQRMG